MPELLADVQVQLEQLERELAEIEILLQQTATEIERHETRRKQVVDRLAALEREPGVDPTALHEARMQVIVLTRRAALMEGQQQVLEGKQKALKRFHEFLAELWPKLPAGSTGIEADSLPPSSRSVLAAQEAMRREIARQMHDGPAQSIANIALQAQIVQRLLQRQPQEAEAELGRLTQMVQHALDATKTFIFDVRPMVLDDLGLVATLRRTTLEQSRRSGVPVRFESVGPDRRLGEEIESGLFRIIKDTLEAYIATRPVEVLVRLDWADEEVRGSVQSRTEFDLAAALQAPATGPREPRAGEVPPALANVMREKEEYEAARTAERERAAALPAETWNDIRARSAALDLQVSLSRNGRTLEVGLAPSD